MIYGYEELVEGRRLGMEEFSTVLLTDSAFVEMLWMEMFGEELYSERVTPPCHVLRIVQRDQPHDLSALYQRNVMCFLVFPWSKKWMDRVRRAQPASVAHVFGVEAIQMAKEIADEYSQPIADQLYALAGMSNARGN